MLACVTDSTQISQHPANSSNTKQLYSFPKGPRFLHYAKKNTEHVLYDNSSQFSKSKLYGKSLGFGVPERPDLFP